MIEIKIRSSTQGFKVLTIEEDYTEVFHGHISEDREVLSRVLNFLIKAFRLVDMGEGRIITQAEYFDLFGKLPEGE